jgi:hypothetical protein
LLAAIGLAAGLVWLWRGPPGSAAPAEGDLPVQSPRRLDVKQLVIVSVLFAQAIGTLATEIAYVSGGGGIITRYLLPAMLPLGAVLAAGILAFGRRLAGLALLVYLGFAWGSFAQWVWVSGTVDGFPWSGRTGNGVPWALVWVAMAGLGVAALVSAAALTDWTRRGLDAPAETEDSTPEPPDPPGSGSGSDSRIPEAKTIPERPPEPEPEDSPLPASSGAGGVAPAAQAP